jgi:protein-tyrosine phosphatase
VKITVTAPDDKLRILFVCLGNICRSPLAEGIFDHLVREAGLSKRFYIDSAGTAAYHVGDPPDERTCAVARARGINLRSRGRQIAKSDLQQFDYIIAMDSDNRAGIERLAARATPHAVIRMLREFDPEAEDDRDVPDPYYGGTRGFENVHDIVERSCRALLDYLRSKHDLK